MRHVFGRAVWSIVAVICCQNFFGQGGAAAAADAPNALPEPINLGPLDLTFGPQENGEFGAVLSGGESIPFDSVRSGLKPPFPGSRFWIYYGAAEYEIDATWSSGSEALNQSTLSLKPQITFLQLNPAESKSVALPPAKQAVCDDLATKADNDSIARFNRECGRITVPSTRFAVALIGEAQYRYGQYDIGGVRHDANQLLFGGGVRVFLPGATRSPLFREWPRLTVSYYSVADSARSTLPDPEAFELDTIAADAKVRMRIPMPGTPWGSSPVRLDLDLRASRPTEGPNQDWEFFREYQLAIEVGREWKPALTYRSGEDKGLQYDRQIIFGVLLELLK